MIVCCTMREVFHVECLACRLLRTLPFLAGTVRALVMVQNATCAIRHRPAELLGLEYNLAHVFRQACPIYPIERHQCHGVLALHRLPACFFEHVESKTRHSNLKSCHAIGFPSYRYQLGFIAIFSAIRVRMICNASGVAV